MHDLMNLEMSRTEFLKLLGVSLISMMGFGFLISMASKMRGSSSQQITKADGDDHEFGTRKFGV
jgi:hypothetical protein